jgi:hypothetical protein
VAGIHACSEPSLLLLDKDEYSRRGIIAPGESIRQGALPPHGLGVFLLLSLQTLVYLICVFRLRILLVVLTIVIIGGYPVPKFQSQVTLTPTLTSFLLQLVAMLYSVLPAGISNALDLSVQGLFFSMLQSIKTGRLEIELRYPSSSKRMVSFGDLSSAAEPVARLTVNDPSIWWQLCGSMDVVSHIPE